MLTFDQYQSAAFESDDAYSSDRSHDDQITRVSLALVAAVHEFNGTDAGYRSDAIVIACKVLRRLSLLSTLYEADFSAIANRAWNNPPTSERPNVTFADYRRRRREGAMKIRDRGHEMLSDAALIAERVVRVQYEGGPPYSADRDVVLSAAWRILMAMDGVLDAYNISLEEVAVRDVERMKEES